jgi:hypothetical protein
VDGYTNSGTEVDYSDNKLVVSISLADTKLTFLTFNSELIYYKYYKTFNGKLEVY